MWAANAKNRQGEHAKDILEEMRQQQQMQQKLARMQQDMEAAQKNVEESSFTASVVSTPASQPGSFTAAANCCGSPIRAASGCVRRHCRASRRNPIESNPPRGEVSNRTASSGVTWSHIAMPSPSRRWRCINC